MSNKKSNMYNCLITPIIKSEIVIYYNVKHIDTQEEVDVIYEHQAYSVAKLLDMKAKLNLVMQDF